MKKIRLIIAAIFLISISIQSCTKDDNALTPNASFTGDSSGNNTNTDTTNTDTTVISSGLVVSPTQRATVTYVGATWCPPCGAYGDPTKLHMESTHSDDVVILNVQSSDAISSAGAFGPNFGSAFQSFVGSTSIPHAYWSGANFAMIDRGFSASASSNNSSADRDINAIIGNTPEVGVAASASISSDSTTITIETLSKFYLANSNTHYIGVYLLEDGVDAVQQISGASAASTSHENVMRAAASTGNALGNESIGASFSIDQEVSGNYSITIPSTVVNKANLQVAVVVWESNQADGISNAILVDVN